MFGKYISELKKLLALEYSCDVTDFGIEENVLTTSELHEGRRMYSKEKYFFKMVTLGKNAVITADDRLDDFLVGYMRGALGYRLFDFPRLAELEKELNKYDKKLSEIYHMFLPAEKVELTNKVDVRWYYDDDIRRFYGDSRFPNAICPEYDPDRPDRIVVCACKGREILGMAGCSEDALHWQQIGVDVMPKYRSKGIGSYLVNILKNKITENGDIPFYCTCTGNLSSWNIALKCGFRPAWTEISSL